MAWRSLSPSLLDSRYTLSINASQISESSEKGEDVISFENFYKLSLFHDALYLYALRSQLLLKEVVKIW